MVKKTTAKKTVKKKTVKKQGTKKTVVKKGKVKKEKNVLTKKTVSSAKKKGYSAKDIFVLKGLEPIRKRPGMYIGTTGPDGLHHLVQEVVCNSIDEAIMGFCDAIEVSLLKGNVVEIKDNGRGIPVDKHPETKKSALETIMTTLHAGGKFGGKAYVASGGLHGIGLSAVCALSSDMRVDVCRDGQKFSQEYARGKTMTKLKKLVPCRQTGTTIIFNPDPEIFKEIKWEPKRILKYLRQQAYLTKGVRIDFSDKRIDGKDPKTYSFYFEGGLASYVKYLTRDVTSRHENVFYAKGELDGVWVEAALRYTQEFEHFEESFANNINTFDGGTHLTGFRTIITRVLNDYARKNNLLKEGDDNFKGQDVREGLTSIISVKVGDPQFEGQTKRRLGNTEVQTVVQKVMGEMFFDWLERNPRDSRSIIESCVIAQKARKAAAATKKTVLRKGILRSLALPGKLADCSSNKPEESELYILEGMSAGGSAKQARDRRFQAILPLKGKILNVERARLDRILGSEEIKALIIALGTAISEDFNLEKLRYHRIVIMCDADVDGAHIKTLLLTLFYRYFKVLIEKGHVFIAKPPLFKVQSGKLEEYAYTEADKNEIVEHFTKANPKQNIVLQRYKGLGEMNPEQLWETTMNPENRTLMKVYLGDAKEADRIFDTLMGKEVPPRKRFIRTHAKSVKNLDI